MAPTTVTFKPNATLQGDGSFTKTGAATSHAATNDNSDASFIKRVSTTVFAAVNMQLDTSSAPSGKALNRFKIRLRNNRPASGLPYLQAGVYVLQPNGATSLPTFGQFQVSGQVGAVQWDESGYFPGDAAHDFLAAAAAGNGVSGLRVWDYCQTSGARANIYEAWVEAEFIDPPTSTVSAPSGTITDTNFPTITWTFTSPESNPQASTIVKVFDSATYGAAGFNPATSTPVWETITSGSALSVTVDEALPATGTFRAYVLVSESTGYITNTATAWAFSTFTMGLLTPPLPTLSAGYDEGDNQTTVVVQGHANLLTANQASLETDLSGWVGAGSNCTATRSTTVGGKVGAAALRLSSTAGGDMSTTTSTGLSGVPVVAGEVYTAVASFRADATARTCRVDVVWYDAAGSVLSTTVGSTLADAVGSWTTDVATIATAPLSAAFAAVKVVVLAAGGASELHYVDTIGLYPGIAAGGVNMIGNGSFEAGTSGWSAFFGNPIGVTKVSTHATHGTSNGRATYTGAGGTGRIVYQLSGLVAGQSYVLGADVYIETAGGCASVALDALFAASSTPQTTSTKDAVVRLFCPFVASAVTQYVSLVGSFSGSGQYFDLDSVQCEPGTTPSAFTLPAVGWSVGGFVSPSIVLERSNDGGDTWLTVRRTVTDAILNGGVTVDSTAQRYTAIDHEAARPGVVLYRARQVAMLSATIVASDYTPNYALTTTSDGQVWLKAVADPTLNAAVRVRRNSFDGPIVEDLAVYRPLGRENEAVVIANDMYGEDGDSLTLMSSTPEEYRQALALARHQGVLLLQSLDVDEDGRGRQWWIRAVTPRQRAWNENPAHKEISFGYVDMGAGG